MTTETKRRLEGNLKELRLPTVKESYAEIALTASKNDLSYEAYLLELMDRECDTRREHRVEKLLRLSRLPLEKSMTSFDKKRLPIPVNAKLKSLEDGSFLGRAENVLAFGKPGTGKTHLLCALGQELIFKGHSVLFSTCSFLVQSLLIAKRDLKLEKFLKRLSKFEAVIIDDIGYVQQSREEMEVLFTFLANRYERGSVLLTSNLAFSKWERIFKDPMTTAAAIDRLVHHSVILELNIPSYRAEKAKKKVIKS